MRNSFLRKQSIGISLLLSLLILVSACIATTSSPSTTVGESTAAESDAAVAFSLDGLAQNSDGYVEILVDQLADAMSNKDFTLVNVHVPDQGNLPMTDLSIAYNDVDAFVAALPDQDASIVIYCRSGGMSSQMAPALADLGYTNLFELEGGFNAWSAAGYELLPSQ